MQTRSSTEPSQETSRLVYAAEYFLTRRKFTDCREFALRAQASDPNHPSPALLIAIASVLSVAYIAPDIPDYYSILGLPRFTSDLTRIRDSFENLVPLLNPKNNTYPLSFQAHELVLKARYVLLNLDEKAQFDKELTKNQGVKSGTDDATFWTMCPYCYHVFEYNIVYKDCCLRCQNVRCRKGFHSVAVAVPPPPEVVEKGTYLCEGFVPLGCNEETEREKMWVPFGSTMVPEKDEGVSKGEHNAKHDEDGAIYISSDDEGFKNYEIVEFQENVNIQAENAI
ncbi:unnamed protein product [Fraxinus pennsylvanica]|uniref:J domain-containing protein n=1 Tax=Fraxinus pennsylvanica TaxID=56036 RepID=A0AAD1Z0Q1_9LAMI|nr:unnamed protein product [Fraxinus pennsylvanica]